ncbi:hypothetical protein H4582DRAFT_743992 [Lactarius indigo]|nr:hypothetical protein H4582DRAFT_743992 [Lactarius indigo]
MSRSGGSKYHAAKMNFWAAITGANNSLKRFEYALLLRNMPVPPMRSTASAQVYLLWSVSSLTSLSVEHAVFLRHPPSVVQFSRVLRNSPLLEVLPYDSCSSSQLMSRWHARASLSWCMIRHSIRTLSSMLCASRAYERLPSTFSCLECHQMRVLAMLLEHTPMLQHAAWKHLDPGALSTSALPAQHMLHVMEVPGSPAAARRALLHSGVALEALGSVCVDAAALEALADMRARRCAISRLRHSRPLWCSSAPCDCSHTCVGCSCPLSTIATSTLPSRLCPYI